MTAAGPPIPTTISANQRMSMRLGLMKGEQMHPFFTFQKKGWGKSYNYFYLSIDSLPKEVTAAALYSLQKNEPKFNVIGLHAAQVRPHFKFPYVNCPSNLFNFPLSPKHTFSALNLASKQTIK
jgi:hypothetical protein